MLFEERFGVAVMIDLLILVSHFSFRVESGLLHVLSSAERGSLCPVAAFVPPLSVLGAVADEQSCVFIVNHVLFVGTSRNIGVNRCFHLVKACYI